jgi:hypothetical protein
MSKIVNINQLLSVSIAKEKNFRQIFYKKGDEP